MSERIAVIRLSSLGDIVCTGLATRILRNRFPAAEIVFVAGEQYVELAAMLPGVSWVAGVRRRGAGFREDVARVVQAGPWDRVVDLQGSRRSASLVSELGARHVVTDKPARVRRTAFLLTRAKWGAFPAVPERMAARLRPWGAEDDGGGLGLVVPDAAREQVRARWGSVVDNAIVLVPGAKHRTKQWPASYWSELLRLLPRDRSVVILGSAGDIPDTMRDKLNQRIIDLTGVTRLPESAALIERAALVVAGDTGPMHMATALGTRLVTLFGPTVREFGFYPFRHPRAEVLERPLACRPCSAHGGRRCPLGHHRCLRDIHPGHVRRAVERALAHTADSNAGGKA